MGEGRMTDARQGTEAKPRILAIDDTPENLLTLKEVLGLELKVELNARAPRLAAVAA